MQPDERTTLIAQYQDGPGLATEDWQLQIKRIDDFRLMIGGTPIGNLQSPMRKSSVLTQQSRMTPF
jgi:hypothetical protein